MSSTSTVQSLRSRPLKREDEYYRRSYHSRSSNPERRSHGHRSSRHRSRRSRRYRSSSSRRRRDRRYSRSRSSSQSRSRSRSRSRSNRRRRRRKYSTSTSRSRSYTRHESNNYNKDKQNQSPVNNYNNNNNNSESKEDIIKTEINKPTTRGKPWEDWEEALITRHTNQIINDRNECKTIFKEENWKNIALKLECETRTKINCTDLIGRSWQAVQSRYYALRKRKRNGKETIKNEANDENNDATNCELKMEFVEKPIKSEHTKNKKRNKGNKVKYEEKNIDNEDEMIAICKLLGIASLKTGIQIYGHYSHLAIYKKVLDLVATDDENERSFKLNNLTSCQLRDIVSKTKSKCKIGRSLEMRDAIQQKIKEFRGNYLKNSKTKNLNHVTENDNDNNSSNEVNEPAQKENDDGDSSGSSSEGENGSDSDSESGSESDSESESGSDSESSIDTVSQSESESEIYIQHKKEERKLLLESLHDSLKREYEKGVRLLCNMRISDNEDLQMRYTNLLKKHTPVLKEINIEMFNHQNIDMREGMNNIKL